MADEFGENYQNNTSSSISSFLRRLTSKRRTWVCLFFFVYALSSSSSSSSVCVSLFAFVLLGALFGILFFVAVALAVAVPATVVTWITTLVLLAFCGKPRRALVVERRKIREDIAGFAVKIVVKEVNIIVAAVCALVWYFVLVSTYEEWSILIDLIRAANS